VASDKTAIIAQLFGQRWDPQTSQLRDTVVTLEQVQEAIERYNSTRPSGKRMSAKNPANFFKDFIRDKRRANKNWPTAIFDAGYTARQTTGGGKCFEFTRLALGQTDAFPLALHPGPETPRHLIESVSLPLASRMLGRAEETWITQVAVRLRLIETHFSLFSSRRNKVVQVDHLQMSVKIGPEIDALFLIIEEPDPGARTEAIATCEAKGLRDDLLEDQILQQVRAISKVGTTTQNTIIPLGLKVVGRSQIYVVEFQAVAREEANELVSLTVASDAVYELRPPVPGIG
jgi:hypothetical protein